MSGPWSRPGGDLCPRSRALSRHAGPGAAKQGGAAAPVREPPFPPPCARFRQPPPAPGREPLLRLRVRSRGHFPSGFGAVRAEGARSPAERQRLSPCLPPAAVPLNVSAKGRTWALRRVSFRKGTARGGFSSPPSRGFPGSPSPGKNRPGTLRSPCGAFQTGSRPRGHALRQWQRPCRSVPGILQAPCRGPCGVQGLPNCTSPGSRRSATAGSRAPSRDAGSSSRLHPGGGPLHIPAMLSRLRVPGGCRICVPCAASPAPPDATDARGLRAPDLLPLPRARRIPSRASSAGGRAAFPHPRRRSCRDRHRPRSREGQQAAGSVSGRKDPPAAAAPRGASPCPRVLRLCPLFPFPGRPGPGARPRRPLARVSSPPRNTCGWRFCTTSGAAPGPPPSAACTAADSAAGSPAVWRGA